LTQPSKAAIIAAFNEAAGILPRIEDDEITVREFSEANGIDRKGAKDKLDALCESGAATTRRVRLPNGIGANAYRLI